VYLFFFFSAHSLGPKEFLPWLGHFAVSINKNTLSLLLDRVYFYQPAYPAKEQEYKIPASPYLKSVC